MAKHKVFIALGGNSGDRMLMMQQAKKMIVEIGCSISNESSVYETPPWGFTATQNFYNQVIEIETRFHAHALLSCLLDIETRLGRTRTSNNYESRTIDLDILFFDDTIINEDSLIIPHPKMHLRNFVLIPMCEIKPDYVHPVLKTSLTDILSACPDKATCIKIP